MERETGFEPATPCLEGRNSTTELLPLVAEIRLQYVTDAVLMYKSQKEVAQASNL